MDQGFCGIIVLKCSLQVSSLCPQKHIDGEFMANKFSNGPAEEGEIESPPGGQLPTSKGSTLT